VSDISKETSDAVYRRDNFICQYCGFDGRTFLHWRQLEIDHVDPEGPRDDPNNCVVCCHHCNTTKQATKIRTLDEARAMMAPRIKAHFDWYQQHIVPNVEWKKS